MKFLKISIIDFLLIFLTFSFFFDSIVNKFVPIPIYVAVNILAFPIIILKGPKTINMLFKTLWFIFVLLLGTILYGVNIKNFSDFIAIINAISIIYCYSNNFNEISYKNIDIIFFVSVILFSFSFIGIDNAPASTIDAQSSSLEYLRKYRSGLFRVPHIASIFFGFFSISYLYLYFHLKKIHYLIYSIISAFFMISVGSRAIIVSILLSLIAFFIKLKAKYIFILITLMIISAAFLLNLEFFLNITRNTILFQYISFFYSFINNITGLSRFIIWESWYIEMSDFNFFDYLIGKSFYSSFLANNKNIGAYIWFHNDYLSIIYSYGIIVLIMFISSLYYLFNRYRNLIRSNIYLFLLFFIIVLNSIFNGYYYYSPILLLYIFFSILNIEKRKSMHRFK